MPLDAVAGGGRATLHPRQNQACQRCSGGTEGGGIGTKCWFLWGMHSVIDSIPRRKSRSVKTRNQSTVLCGQLWPRGVTGVGGVMKQIEFGFRIYNNEFGSVEMVADCRFIVHALLFVQTLSIRSKRAPSQREGRWQRRSCCPQSDG